MKSWLIRGSLLFWIPMVCLSAEETVEPNIMDEIQRLHERIDELIAATPAEEPATPEKLDDGKEILKTVYDGGYFFLGHNDTLQIGGFAQVDYRHFFDNHPGVNQFLIRRARVDIRGTLEKVWAYRLYFSFGGTSGGRLQHAWLEYKKWKWFRIRVGQYKEPFSIEALTSSPWLRFVERALGPTNLAPFEDIGIQFFGSLDCDKWVYAVGLFNGQGINKNDRDDSKDLAGRITFQPFRYFCSSPFKDFYIGAAGTTGYDKFDLDGKKYVTGLRTTFQTFGASVEQRGNLSRVGFEFDWCKGPFWMGGEYIFHRREGVRDAENKATVRCNSWYVGMAYLLTGEYQVKNGPVKPCRDFDPCKCGSWGAWEVNARYDEFHTNHRPFELGLIAGTDKVKEYTLGIIWWPNDIHVKFWGNFIYSDFGNTVRVNGHNIRDEKGVVFRGQYVF